MHKVYVLPQWRRLDIKQQAFGNLSCLASILFSQDPERRSQLWRMTSSRQLVHISSSASSEKDMVLSLAGRLPPPGQFTPLLVEKRRQSREDKQTWRFTEVHTACVLFKSSDVSSLIS